MCFLTKEVFVFDLTCMIADQSFTGRAELTGSRVCVNMYVWYDSDSFLTLFHFDQLTTVHHSLLFLLFLLNALLDVSHLMLKCASQLF